MSCSPADSTGSPRARALPFLPVLLGGTLLLAAPTVHAQAPALAQEACVACHSDPGRVPSAAAREPVALLQHDVHFERGFSCHDCHGGDPSGHGSGAGSMESAHAASAGFVGRPGIAEIPAFCGKCHSDGDVMAGFDPDARIDQEALYATSVHGRQLAQGNERVAQCLSCHGHAPDGPGPPKAHGIRPLSDPNNPVHPTNVADTCARCHADAQYMQPFRIPTDQLEQYMRSVHATQLYEHEDLSAPTCNDCHGNHGARPPGAESTANVCGTCHGRQSELFRQSTMITAFDMMGLGECIVCHDNHAILKPHDAMLVDAPPAPGAPEVGCHQCHTDADDPALTISGEMRRALEGLVADIDGAHTVIRDARLKGMPVAEAEYQLVGARDALIEARAQVHRFELPPLKEVVDRGGRAVAEARALGDSALAEFAFRHRWLAVSLVGIAVVIVALVFKVRSVDRRWRAGATVKEP